MHIVEPVMRLLLCLIIAAIFIPACDSIAPDNATGAYDIWRAAGIHNYTVDQMRSCFCPEGGETIRITVRSDSIISVVRIADNSEVPLPLRSAYLTIDSLFGIIRSPHNDSIAVLYNPRLGYPERLDVNPQLHPVDGGFLIVTSNLRIL
jgi:hypothetical protein